MEFQNRKKALGVIDVIKNNSVQIKIIAVKDKDKDYKILTQEEARILFPPNGFVFGASFLKEYPHLHEKDLIDIDSLLNQQVSEHDYNKDKYIVDRGSAKKHYVKTIRISNPRIDKYSLDLNDITLDSNEFEGDFFGYTETKIFGKLRMKNGKLSPVSNKRINMWDLDECETVAYKNEIYLLGEPKGESMPLDCMDDKQLFDWFREELKKIEPEYVNLLDKKAKWRTEIPKLFYQSNKERNEVDRVRFVRIKEKFEYINLNLSDIITLVEKSNSLKKAFNVAIEKHKEEFKTKYENQLNDEIRSLKESKTDYESTITKLKSEIENSQFRIEELTQNKDRILADFSIIKEVFGNEMKATRYIETSDLFVIENIEKPKDVKLLALKDDFIIALKNQLQRVGLSPLLAKRIIDVMSDYYAIFISDIRIGIAMIEATNNATYIIQNVEPDWLHFSNLWENGLGAIWQTAHENPEKLHFLILEDINLSSPECYGRPLLDMILGVRKVIPYGKAPYPKNLRILATVAPVENPEIGLPLNKVTFNGWAAIGFTDDIYGQLKVEIEKTKGFVDTNSFLNFIPDELEADGIKAFVNQEYSNLFDSE